jgi:hypothetical protein
MSSSAAAVDLDELATCIRVLKHFHSDMEAFKRPEFKSLRQAVLPLCEDIRSRIFFGNDVDTFDARKQKKQERKRKDAQAAALDRKFINNTRLRMQRLEALDTLTAANPMLPQVPDGAVVEDMTPQKNNDASFELHGLRSCYVCKKRFTTLHHFYDQLCSECATLNFQKRMQSADLSGFHFFYISSNDKMYLNRLQGVGNWC